MHTRQNTIIKSILYSAIMLIFTLNLSAKEFVTVNGNGCLSHDQKWYVSIETGSYNNVPFLRFEVISLEKNKFKASSFFTYSDTEKEKVIPEVLLIHKECGNSRNADIRWTKDSQQVFVYFDSSYRESTFVISYDVRNGNVSTFYMKKEEYSKIKKNNEKNSLPSEGSQK